MAAWLLIGEIPSVVASGDKDLWEGLKVTVFFRWARFPGNSAFVDPRRHPLSKGARFKYFPDHFLYPLCDTRHCQRGCLPTDVFNRYSSPVTCCFHGWESNPSNGCLNQGNFYPDRQQLGVGFAGVGGWAKPGVGRDYAAFHLDLCRL